MSLVLSILSCGMALTTTAPEGVPPQLYVNELTLSLMTNFTLNDTSALVIPLKNILTGHLPEP